LRHHRQRNARMPYRRSRIRLHNRRTLVVLTPRD
jgi:hypothetical protein